MPRPAIISPNAAGVGRNVGDVRLREAVLPHVDDAHVHVGGVRGDPVRLDELFGMGVRDGQHSQCGEHAAKFSVSAADFHLEC
jgi:hypothetical protein